MFFAVGDDDVGTVAMVDVFENDAFSATVKIIGDGNGFTPIEVDLSAFNDVTRIEIHDVTDTAGLGYDDFTFTTADFIFDITYDGVSATVDSSFEHPAGIFKEVWGHFAIQ